MHALIETAFSKWITTVFAWLIALILANGALVHVLNILGKGKSPWREFPLLWRIMDVVLLIFNVIVIAGLILGATWSVYVLFVGILLFQIVPYTILRSKFASTAEEQSNLNGLIAIEVLLLLIFAVLIVWQGRGGGV